MKTPMKILIVAALAVAVAGAVVLKKSKTPANPKPRLPPLPRAGRLTARLPKQRRLPNRHGRPRTTAKLPRMVDLGAGKCIPCKMMEPILED